MSRVGFNFQVYTPCKIPYELMRWDEEFKDADYTQLVAVFGKVARVPR